MTHPIVNKSEISEVIEEREFLPATMISPAKRYAAQTMQRQAAKNQDLALYQNTSLSEVRNQILTNVHKLKLMRPQY